MNDTEWQPGHEVQAIASPFVLPDLRYNDDNGREPFGDVACRTKYFMKCIVLKNDQDSEEKEIYGGLFCSEKSYVCSREPSNT